MKVEVAEGRGNMRWKLWVTNRPARVARISHRDQVEDLVARGRDLERVVLARAVKWHLYRRIPCYGKKTVVFD
jgi:formyltetrahydrofolate hydrolase